MFSNCDFYELFTSYGKLWRRKVSNVKVRLFDISFITDKDRLSMGLLQTGTAPSKITYPPS
jgi:hypothetical protein